MPKPSSFFLSSGQCLHLSVERGTQIVAVCGNFEITGPAQWLADSVISPSMVLREGEAQLVEQDGMITVVSRGSSELLCLPAPSRLPAILSALGAPFAPLRRRSAKTRAA